MGKASSNKKVARAARTGGSRKTRGGRGSMLFPGLIGFVVVLGVALIVVSRGDDTSTASPALGEHFHNAYGIYLCDAFQPPLNDALADPLGIHTHGDGLIHIHPTSSLATGGKATFDKFAEDVALKVSDDSIEMPDGTKKTNGDECDGKPGTLKTAIWSNAADETPEIIEGNPGDVKLRRNTNQAIIELMTIAFVAEGAEIPKPPSANTAPQDVPGATPEQPPLSVVITSPPDPSATSAPDSSATSAPPGDGTATTTP